MTSVAERLADRALAAAAAPDAAVLRPLILTNLSAALGATDGTERPLVAVVSGTDPASAAFRLAARMHVRTQDDFFPSGRVHVGAVVVPPVLALGTDNFWGAVAAGYAVFTVIAATYSADCQDRGFRPSGIMGPPAAAAAAGVALGLSRDQLAAAIAAAATASAGTNQAWVDGSGEWLLEVAHAARAGVEAAQLVDAGLPTAVGRGFEGRSGWGTAYFGDAGASRLVKQLDSGDQTYRVATKPYPVSGIAQVPTHLSTLLGAKLDHHLPDRMVVAMPTRSLDYPGSRNRGPFRSRSDSLMSVARCCAVAYLSGYVSINGLSAPPSADEARLVDAIELVADDSAGPEGVTVTVEAGGTELSRHGDADELLYPTWAELRSDLAGLATRSEAAEAEVTVFATALDSEHVETRSLLARLEPSL